MNSGWKSAAWRLMLLLAMGGAAVLPAREAKAAEPTAETVQRLGERLYRDGILPSGQPVQGYVSGDVPVSGDAFTCVSCHLRSGLGSIEGQVVTPPTTGAVLYQPREPYVKGAEYVPLIHNYAVYLPTRPAYTDATLGRLLTVGVDPTGRAVTEVMPRYDLGKEDLALLIAYLKTLSPRPSPGVGEKEIAFATVIVDGSDPVAVESMLLPLQFSVDRKNSLTVAGRANPRVARMGYNMLGNLTDISFTLRRWRLTGPPETWRAQLDAYYQAEPVFALLGGISPGEWEPVRRFCEENRLPDLLPVLDYPEPAAGDWYTLYVSRGVRQEGEAAARYLHGMYDLIKERPVVQVVRDTAQGRALAAGFREAWAATGHPPAQEMVLSAGQRLDRAQLEALGQGKPPAALLLWDDATAVAALEGLARSKERPGLVLMSASQLDRGLWTLPESLRDWVYIAYPYRLPQDDARYDVALRKVFAGKRSEDYDPRIVRQSYITTEILGKALMEMRGEFHRDFLLDTIGMLKDMYVPLYERVSFGPGQRFISKGCYIVQLGKGAKPQLQRRSEWGGQ